MFTKSFLSKLTNEFFAITISVINIHLINRDNGTKEMLERRMILLQITIQNLIRVLGHIARYAIMILTMNIHSIDENNWIKEMSEK